MPRDPQDVFLSPPEVMGGDDRDLFASSGDAVCRAVGVTSMVWMVILSIVVCAALCRAGVRQDGLWKPEEVRGE